MTHIMPFLHEKNLYFVKKTSLMTPLLLSSCCFRTHPHEPSPTSIFFWGTVPPAPSKSPPMRSLIHPVSATVRLHRLTSVSVLLSPILPSVTSSADFTPRSVWWNRSSKRDICFPKPLSSTEGPFLAQSVPQDNVIEIIWKMISPQLSLQRPWGYCYEGDKD